jgi:hypothetical protein
MERPFLYFHHLNLQPGGLTVPYQLRCMGCRVRTGETGLCSTTPEFADRFAHGTKVWGKVSFHRVIPLPPSNNPTSNILRVFLISRCYTVRDICAAHTALSGFGLFHASFRAPRESPAQIFDTPVLCAANASPFSLSKFLVTHRVLA